MLVAYDDTVVVLAKQQASESRYNSSIVSLSIKEFV